MRMNIWVPDDLKARMDAVRDEVNWSSLACRAFQEKLGQIAASKERKSMQDVIDRLTASKQETDSHDYQVGYRLGREWAQDQAEAHQLQRLADAMDEGSCPLFSSRRASASTMAKSLAMLAEDANQISIRDIADFWERAVGDEWGMHIRQRQFVIGFAKGAVGLWRMVEDQLH